MARSIWIRCVFVLTAALCVAGCGSGTSRTDRSPRITSTPSTTATVGVPYTYAIASAGMTPLVYMLVQGPAGMTVGPETGVVDWTPSEEGTFSVEVAVTNVAGSDSQSFDLMVSVSSGPAIISTPPEEASVGAEYAYDPEVVANGPVTWTAPTAPTGLAIDSETGSVRWTPNASQTGPNAITLRVAENDGGAFAEQRFEVMVEASGGPAVITSTPPLRVVQGETWTYDATASGAPTILWSIVDPGTGTPATGVSFTTTPAEGPSVTALWNTTGVSPGDYTVAFEVRNGVGSPSTQVSTVTVDPRPPVPVIDLSTTPPPAEVFVGTAYSYDVNVTAASESEGLAWSLVPNSTEPTDLAITVDSETGEVNFTATEENGERQYQYAVRVTNAVGESDEATISVNAVLPPATPVLTITPTTSFVLEVGEGFPGASASATGNPTPSLSTVGTLPPFVEFDALTGLLFASTTQPVPTNADIGSYSFDVVATNAEGSDSDTINIEVIAAPPTVDSITPAAGRRQSAVPIVVRGAGFVESAGPAIVLEFGGYTETLVTTFVSETMLAATVPVDMSRPPGVYDVLVDQGSAARLAKRFTVTEGEGAILVGTIAEDVTLTVAESPYRVTGDVRVESGITVTLEPGAVVMFDPNTNFRIDVGVASAGALVADGGVPGVGDQVVFTRYQEVGGPAPSGYYRGLRFGANVITANNVLRNAVVEYGGRRNAATDQGAIEVLSGSAPTVVDSIVRESSERRSLRARRRRHRCE